MGTVVVVQLLDVAGIVLWEGRSDAGVARAYARPPYELLPRVCDVHVHLESLPITGEAPEEPYLGDLECGCLVRYTYRPGLTAHCPTHGVKRVRRVTYPLAPEYR